jgi:acyl carrier protein
MEEFDMTAEQLLDKIRKSLRLPNLEAGARMGAVRGWDSLRHVRLMLELEKEFGVRIPTDQFGSLTSVEAIGTYFSQCGKLAA